MKIFYLYKRWNYLLLLNNLIVSSFLTYTKPIIFLQTDIYKFFFWNYTLLQKKIESESKNTTIECIN